MPQDLPNSISEDITLKVGLLFAILKKEGFKISTDDYIDFVNVFKNTIPLSIEEIAYNLCPIVVTNADEQKRFHEIIRKYSSKEIAPKILNETIIVEPPRTPKWYDKKIISTIAWILLLLTSVFIGYLFFANSNKQAITIFPVGKFKRSEILKKNKPSILSVAQLAYFNDRPNDTSKIGFYWDFGNGDVSQGISIKHTFKAAGDYIIIQKAFSSFYRILNPVDTIYAHVCESSPRLQLLKPINAVLGNITPINALSDSSAQKYKWLVDGIIQPESTSPTIEYRFLSAGYHQVTCTALADNFDTLCNTTSTINFEVLDNSVNYNVSVDGSNHTSAKKLQLKKSVLLAICFTALFIIILMWAIKEKKETDKIKVDEGIDKKNVFEIPFQVNEFAIIKPSKNIYKALHLMRRRGEEEILELNLMDSMKSTIAKMGLTQFVYAPRKKFAEYLILIDNKYPNGSFTFLFGYLSRLMLKTDVHAVIYWYDGMFLFHNPNNPAGIQLEQVLNNNLNSLPILLGDGSNLLYGLIPAIRKQYLPYFNIFSKFCIITNVPKQNWGIREDVLCSKLLLSNADEDELLATIEKLHINFNKQKTKHFIKAACVNNEIRNWKDLEKYFNGDPFLLQWLCTIGLYPKLRWEIILTLGNNLSKEYKDNTGIAYKDLLKMASLPWLVEGKIPPSIRLELLKRIKFENEINARIILVQMLEQAKLTHGSGYYYDSELEDQLTINKFILYVHNPKVYGLYKNEVNKLQKLWSNGLLLDSPLRLYLENHNKENWQTPLHSNGIGVHLKDYFSKAKAIQPIKKTIYYKWTATLGIVLIAFFCIRYLQSFEVVSSKNKFASFFSEVSLDSTTIEYKLFKNTAACGNSNGFPSDLTGQFNIGNQLYNISYVDSTQTIFATIPNKIFTDKNNSISLTIDAGMPSTLEENINIDTLWTHGSIRFGCEIIQKDEKASNDVAYKCALIELINNNAGKNKYITSVGFDDNGDWALAFVLWCYMGNKSLPVQLPSNQSITMAGFLTSLKLAGYLFDYPNKKYYEVIKPTPGDIVFFDFGHNKGPEQCGIVESTDSEFVYSVEGNTNNGNEINTDGKVKKKKRYLKDVLCFASIFTYPTLHKMN